MINKKQKNTRIIANQKIIMKKICALAALLFCLSCNQLVKVEGKVFARNSEIGIVYIFFRDENNYSQVLYKDSVVTEDEGIYIKKGSQITLYNFIHYDKELLSLFGNQKVGNLISHLRGNIIYFHYDVPEINFQKLNQKSLPKPLRKYLNKN